MSSEEEEQEEHDDGLDELSDRELLEMMGKALPVLYELREADPDTWGELVRKSEAAFIKFKEAVALCEKMDRELEVSAEALKIAANELLLNPALPNGKPIPIVPPKHKGN